MELNESIKSIINDFHENKLSHVYLLETNNLIECYNELSHIIKMIICPNSYKEGCTDCNLCHLINENNLPSIIEIKSNGSIITKDQIDFIKKSFSTIPIYTLKNIYIIESPEKMNDTAFNKLLKFLEEPQDNILGFLISDNSSSIAPTIYSRCTKIKVIYGNSKFIDNSKYVDVAKEYLDIITSDYKKGIWYNVNVLEKNFSERVDIINFMNTVLSLIDMNNNLKLSKLVIKYINQLEYNVNINLLLDSFVLEVGEVYEK